jgi:hypothetical protein
MERRASLPVPHGLRRHMEAGKHQRPSGFIAIGIFFLFGATMAAYAAVTLLKPGTALDALWVLNGPGHAKLLGIGKGAGLGFLGLAGLLGAASVGWFRRRYWGWLLGTTIIAINVAGDLENLAIGEHWKGAVGVTIGGVLLIYLIRPGVRNYFIGRGEH